jgi:hypothetical protein
MSVSLGRLVAVLSGFFDKLRPIHAHYSLTVHAFVYTRMYIHLSRLLLWLVGKRGKQETAAERGCGKV